MKKIVSFLASFILLAQVQHNCQKLLSWQQAEQLPEQALLPTEPVTRPVKFPLTILSAAIPTVKKIADITGEQISSVGSQDMTIEIWKKLAVRINEIIAKKEADGIVVTHGTDTQEETAYFLDLVVPSKCR